MSCKWKNCKNCGNTCLWARGMSRLFSESNLENRLQERIDIDCSDNTKELLSNARQFVELGKIIVVESNEKDLSTLLAVKFLQNYFNQVAEEASVDGLGVYIPVIEWIKRGLDSTKSNKDELYYFKVKNLIQKSRLIVWDVLGRLTEYQKEELSMYFYSSWMKGKSQVITLFPGWKDIFKTCAMGSLLDKAKVVKI